MANNQNYSNYGGWNNGTFYPPVNSIPYMYQQPQAQQSAQSQAQQPQPQAQSNGVQFSFVSGVENAKNYLQLSTNAVLYDDESDILYMKKTDNGKSEVKCFSLTEIEIPKPVTSADASKFVTKDDFDKFTAKIDGLINQLSPFLGQFIKPRADEKPTAKEG